MWSYTNWFTSIYLNCAVYLSVVHLAGGLTGTSSMVPKTKTANEFMPVISLRGKNLVSGHVFLKALKNGFILHVCSRQKAETYETTYDRAFICPERYTTACGQLDWRRCSKYRVNTCYSPTQKYAIRYYTVEECCPGWKDAGSGACTLPVCTEGCENGARCSGTSTDVPGCICPENYYGSRCQYGKHTLQQILIIAVLCLASCLGFTIVLHFYCRHLQKRSNTIEHIHLQRLNSMESEQLLSETNMDDSVSLEQNEHRNKPSAPQKE